MTNSLYYIESVSSMNALLIVYVKPFKMLKPRILRTLFRILLEPRAFSLSRWF
jgi:hypothetical protein